MNASLLGNWKRGGIIYRRSAVLTLLLFQPQLGSAEDFKLSDGTVLRHAQVIEVRPDALVLAHDGGIAMADFAKLPSPIRKRYGYDPGKAAAYRIRENAKQRAKAQENQRLITAHEERKQALLRARWAAAEATETASEFAETHLFLHAGDGDHAYAAAITRLGTEIAQVEESRIVAERRSTTFWGAPFWKHPIAIFLGSLLGSGGKGDGTHSEPRNWR